MTQDASVVNVAELYAELFRIYPNPTRGIFNISQAHGDRISMNVTVQDLNGKVLLDKAFQGKKEYRIDLSSVQDGSYNIIIKTIKSTLVRKLVIVK